MSEVSLDQQIAEVEREIGLRRALYPRWINEKRMKPEKAQRCLETMEAVLATLKSRKEKS
jgi:hypothetical protein